MTQTFKEMLQDRIQALSSGRETTTSDLSRIEENEHWLKVLESKGLNVVIDGTPCGVEIEAMIYEKTEDLIKAWENGEDVKSVSMGGLSEGYERAIQELAMSVLSDVLKENPINAFVQKKIKEFMKGKDYGYSGTQVDAAKNMISVFYFNGHRKGIEMAGEDRIITVRKEKK